MNQSSSIRSRALRVTPLASCLAVAIAAASSGDALAAGASSAANPSAILGSGAHPHFTLDRITHLSHVPRSPNPNSPKRIKANASLAAHPAHGPQQPPRVTTPVTSCLDDGSPGTLRDVITNAGNGDIVDLSASGCSTITLQTGVIATMLDDLTIKGSGRTSLTVDGNGSDSILFHFGTGTLTLQDITLTNASYSGAYAKGGAVYSTANVELDNAAISNSTISGQYAIGGAVFAFGNLTISNSVISGNTANSSYGDGYAGGVAGIAGLSISNSTISGNSAIGAPYASDKPGYGRGGGLISVADLTISGSTLTRNTADAGGALALFEPQATAAPALLSDSTISGNTGNLLAGGVFGGYTLKAQNSTVAFNAGNYYGAGGLLLLDDTELESTIVSNNTGATDPGNIHRPADAYDPNISGNGTIIGANNLVPSSDIALPGDTISTDPNLQPLANNGGPTFTHALVAGSSAIDKGNNLAGLTTDQRGLARVSGNAADIGAYELEAPAVVVPVPTVSAWALAAMAAALGWFGWRQKRRQPQR